MFVLLPLECYLQLEEIPAIPCIPNRKERVKKHERVWLFAYPHLTRRALGHREFFEYQDAKYRLCYSPGLVLTNPKHSEWFTDSDSALGSSGAPVLDDEGHVIGLFWGGGSGGGLASKLDEEHKYRYRRVIDLWSFKKAHPYFFDS